MYVNKKFMLLVAFFELKKPINWVQVVFNNLHSKLQHLSTIIKLNFFLKKKTLERRRNSV